MATAEPQPDGPSEAFSGNVTDDYDPDGEENEESRMESSNATSSSTRDRDKKIGHRRVDKSGIVSYKKKPTSELMAAIQLGIGQSVGGLSSKPERDMLMQDFGVVEVVFFPGEGSNLTPAHHYSDFRFKTYAPVAFRYFRHLFGIQPDDFMLSLCDEHLKELSNPGASGSIFYLTYDDEFIIKTVQHKEAEFLQKLLPGYFLNISQNKRTLLPKFYGLYCYQCGGKNIRFTVMNNLLPSTVKLHEKYDMKGSTYKRKASKHERAKKSPTLKDLDFMENHPEGLSMEKDTYDALIKTLQRDTRVLESFKIMDYSLLMGIYNLDLANKEKQTAETSEGEHSPNQEQGYTPNIDMSTQGHSGLQRGKSFKTRIGQYSTPMESIQGNRELTEDLDEDEDVPPGGIPARNAKGERLLIYLGIIDILQSFRLKKRLEHTVKSMVIDGDTISVHRPSYYAQRFLQFHATRVFKKAQPGSTALKHSPSKKRSQVKTRSAPASDGSEGIPGSGQHGRSERGGRTISFSDEAQSGASGAVGGRPDLLPEHSHMRNSGSRNRTPSPRLGAGNVNGNSRHQKRSEAFNMTTYPSDDGLSSSSLRGLSSPGGRGGASPPLSLSESTPTHTDFTEGTPSFTNSSPSCSSEAMVTSTPARSSARFRRVSFEDGETRTLPLRPAIRSFSPSSPSSGHGSGEGHSVRFSSDVQQQQQEHTTTTTTTTTNSSATTITTGTAAAVVAEAVYDMGSSNPLDSAGLDDTPQHRGHHHYTQRSPDMRHRGNRAREAVTSSSPSLHQHQQLQQQQQQQQQSSVTTVKTEVVEYVESSVTVKVTPESPSPSLATPVHFSMPPAVKDAPDATGQGSNMGRGEPQEVTSPVAAVSGAGGDLQAEEEGLTATASEMTDSKGATAQTRL